MIDLNAQRPHPLHVCEIRLKDLPDVDLKTVQIGDWMEGFGSIDSYSVIGFLKQAGRLGLCLAYRKVDGGQR